jgi:hypothetical protein
MQSDISKDDSKNLVQNFAKMLEICRNDHSAARFLYDRRNFRSQFTIVLDELIFCYTGLPVLITDLSALGGNYSTAPAKACRPAGLQVHRDPCTLVVHSSDLLHCFISAQDGCICGGGMRHWVVRLGGGGGLGREHVFCCLIGCKKERERNGKIIMDWNLHDSWY